ncbi:MAG: hypothetical protein CO108_25080 [Deltaproteobacteria bacterium CG_4_9_14_3_um_filter_63_12]|nr:MAG: hypothetical protein CO108_25080 [Deltaproteobacteria bacterium CG_4_9_14_3_um_filter_63_12]
MFVKRRLREPALAGLIIIQCALWLGCAEELAGPKPGIESPAPGQALPVDPGIVCKMQHPAEGTATVVTGSKLSPLPFDIPDAPKTALPQMTLVRTQNLDGSAGDNAEVVYGGRPGEANADLLHWQSQDQMTFMVKDDLQLSDGSTGNLPEGVYDLRITNANTNQATSAGALAVVDRPRVSQVTPGVVCVEQGNREITLQGTTILQLNGVDATLSVGGVSLLFDSLDSCTPVAHKGLMASTCTDGVATIAQNTVAPGFHAVEFQNPATADCVSVPSEDAIDLRVVPAPVITAVRPPMACVAEGPRQVVLEGTGFLEIDSVLPAVTMDGVAITVVSIAGTCEDLETMGHTVRTCTEVTVEIPEDAAQTEVLFPVIELTNPEPAGCSSSTSTGLVLVPTPILSDVQPPLICVDDTDQQLEFSGSGFIFVDGVPPTVAFDGVDLPAADVTQPTTGCETLPVEGLAVQRCASILVNIPQGSQQPGSPVISVTNPDPAGCSAAAPDLLTIVEGPKILFIAPPLVCTDDSARTLTITGTGFLTIGGANPEVVIDGNVVTVDTVSGCAPVAANGLTVESCTGIDVTIAQGSLSEGNPLVIINNPTPAGCSTISTTALVVPPALTIASAEPATICQTLAGTLDVTVRGTGFLRVDGADFEVQVEGVPVVPSSITDCTALTVDGLTVDSCDTFVISVNAAAYPVGGVAFSVTNPAPSGCASTTSGVFAIVAPPTITGVVPSNICSDVTESLTITGGSFAAAATVTVGTTTATAVTVDPSGNTLVADFASGIPAGTYDLTVQNGVGCSDTLVDALTVDPTPIVFFVDPPVLYNGASIEITVFTSGLTANAATLELVDTAGTVTDISGFSSPIRPNRILAPIPSGLPPDTYEVRVTSAIGCVGGLPGALVITDQLTIALDTIDPGFVSPTKPTAVTITAIDPAPAGFVQFVSTPRAYLNPNPTGAGATAIGLRAMIFEDATKLTAVVPDGMTPGQYDLIVVNPDGTVGLSVQALTVTTGEPPVITAVVPNSMVDTANAPMTIRGDDLPTDPSQTTVERICKNPTTGVITSAAANVTSADGSVVQALMPVTGDPAGSVCLVKLTDDLTGASFTYSAVSIKNPSFNLAPWKTAPAMVEGRRALSLIAGRPTNTSRFVYAIGGDGGTLASAKTSVEGVGVDVFGTLATWLPQSHSLPSPRSFAGSARVGRFVYLTGGYDGSTATDTTLRAQILDPLAGPEVLDLDALLGDGTSGLDGGLWYYRIAATFPTTDASNPGGESLPGEVLTVQLPALPDKIELTLTWAEIPGANGYRIYRSPSLNGSVDSLELLGEMSCAPDRACQCGVDFDCKFLDDGLGTTTAGAVPLPQGSLGVWHTLTGSPLTTTREGHVTVAVNNPNAADEVYLYAFGGRSASGTYLDTYEYATLTVGADGSQSLSTWTVSPKGIGGAKADLVAWVVDPDDTNLIPGGQAFIFVGSGTTGATSWTGDVSSGRLDATSTSPELITTAPGALDAETSFTPTRGAGGGGDASGRLYVFGGQRNSLSTSDTSTALVAGPDLDNWNSLGGGSINVLRAYCSVAQESAFFFIAGGTTGTDTASTSVETTVQ